MDLLGVASGCGRFNSFGGVDHHAVKFAQSRCGFFTLKRFALESIINWLPERIPHFLLLLAVNRHALRFLLPPLLQVLDGVDVKHWLCAQHARLVNHGFTPGNALAACGFERCVGRVHRGLPHRLNVCKNLFTQMPAVLPFFNKAIQTADVHLPIGVCFVGICPGRHFVNQQLALGFDDFGLLFNGFQPDFNHLVSLVAGVVKTLPERVVGRAALVGCFPQVAHVAQRVLLFSASQRLDEQRFSLANQFFADLVRTPALPAFQLAGSRERSVGSGFELAVNISDVLLECVTQLGCDFGSGFAVPLADFMFQFGNCGLYSSAGFFPHVFEHSRVDFGSCRAHVLLRRCHAARSTQFVSPNMHSRQWRSAVNRRLDRHAQCCLKSLPHCQQLAA